MIEALKDLNDVINAYVKHRDEEDLRIPSPRDVMTHKQPSPRRSTTTLKPIKEKKLSDVRFKSSPTRMTSSQATYYEGMTKVFITEENDDE